MLDNKYRGRRKGIAIRPGSVLQARREAGLSLAEVASGKFSRAAIHQIEMGRNRPSLESLQLIARRTRKPIDYFLPAPGEAVGLDYPESQLRELEQLTSTRQFEAVLELGLPLLEKRLDDNDASMIRFHVGQAYCRLVKPQEALPFLAAARKQFEAVGDAWMAVEAMDWEANARGHMEDPEAISLAHKALERCRQLEPKPPQTEARILGHIANMYVVSQSWSQAVSFYQSAVESAGAVKDLLQQANMHHGLAAAYQRMQQPAKARQHFDKALALYSIESDLSAVYRVENDLGDLLLKQGQLDAAEDHLRRALAGSEQWQIDRRGRGFILLSFGELFLRRGQMDHARDYLAQALTAGQATDEEIVLAEGYTLLGQTEEREGNIVAADEQFAKALEILERLGMPDRLRDCHMQYAEVLSARGDVNAAAEHWRLAAQIGKLVSSGLKVADQDAERAG